MTILLARLPPKISQACARSAWALATIVRRETTDAKSSKPIESRRWYQSGSRSTYVSLAALVSVTGAGIIYLSHLYLEDIDSKKGSLGTEKTGPQVRRYQRNPGITYYSRKDVAWHNTSERGVWITYNNSVYDITQFIQHHPGGSRTIMMGAGGDVGPFWQTYTVHKAAEVQKLLSQYKIGELNPEECQLEAKSDQVDPDGPYANEPSRSPLLIVQSETPFNAETPADLLTETQITPTEIFFVRNHLPVPEIDIEDYEIEILKEYKDESGERQQQLLGKLTYDELKTKFKPYRIEAVIQCSGNRRNDLKRLKEIKGLDWKLGAIGNAEWTGARLVDVLQYFGLDYNSNELLDSVKHVQTEGLDSDMSGQAYGASITADIALNPKNDVLLAYEMNGEKLTRDHGFPVRFIAPGVAGARSVKWLSKIVLSDEESRSHWQRNDYKSFSPSTDLFNIDYSKSLSIQEMPVQSAICEPKNGDSIEISKAADSSLTFRAKGYAWSGGGKTIVRVDLSIDNGNNWITAKLLRPPIDEAQRFRNRDWSWSLWAADIPIPKDLINSTGQGNIELLCRAFDASYNSQPERPDAIWNVRGVVNNAWHRVGVTVNLT
ncbi:Sulfite oxidase, mitochondrial, partial [Fragariocoptes setiger]